MQFNKETTFYDSSALCCTNNTAPEKNGSLYYCSPKANLNTCAKESISFNEGSIFNSTTDFLYYRVPDGTFCKKPDLTGGIKDKKSAQYQCVNGGYTGQTGTWFDSQQTGLDYGVCCPWNKIFKRTKIMCCYA